MLCTSINIWNSHYPQYKVFCLNSIYMLVLVSSTNR